MYLVAHDLKNPITHIQMLVELLRRDAARLAPLPSGESGTGLGLFITQQIVRLHGGRIWLESRENEGTRFVIDLR